MLEMKRIYWTRLGIRLAYAATTVWLFASAILSLMPQATTGAMAGRSSVAEMLGGMFDGWLRRPRFRG
jgi:hypothetical protein